MKTKLEKVMNHMKWVASLDIEPEKRAYQCYGILMGAEIALDLQYGKEWDELTEFWEHLRAEILR